MSLNIKKIILCNIFIFAIFCISVFANTYYLIEENEYEYRGTKVTIRYEDEIMKFDVEPIIHEDRTLLPIRALVEKAGGEVGWNEETREVIIKKDEIDISMGIGNKIAKVNGEDVEMDVAPCIAYEGGNADAGRTVVPIRFVMENLGLDVKWDQETYTVSIEKKEDENIDNNDTKEENQDNNSEKDEETNIIDKAPVGGNNEEEDEIQETIRIGLYYETTSLKDVTFKANTKMYLGNFVNDEFENKLEINSGETLKLEIDTASSKYLKVWVNGKLVEGIEGVVQVIPEYNSKQEQRIKVQNSEYRGIIEVERTSYGIRVINIVSLEEYLYSVVPSEIESSSDIEAIKAQAVAARTYAKKELNRHGENKFDLCATTHCQMYRGTSWERERPIQAVNETEGLVIRYNGELITAVYSASSGGHTEDVENVWGGSYPYLKGVEDTYEPKSSPWKKTYTKLEIEKLLLDKGVDIGKIKSIKTEYSDSGRVIKLVFNGTKVTKMYTKESTRLFFGLKSQMYTLELVDDRYGILENVIEKLEDGEEVTIAKVTTQALNFRESNTTEAEIIKQLNTGELYEIIEIEEEWAKIIVEENEGWVSTDYIDIAKYTDEDLEDLLKEYEDPNREFTVEIVGYGSGHGVGMSQNGAKGMANEGFTFEEILKHYYTGVTVEK